MANPFIKQVGQSASDFAKKIAKQVAREPLEVIKNVGTSPSGEKPPSIGENIPMQETPDVTISKMEEEIIKTRDTSKLSSLEAEVQRLINERKQKEEEWKKRMDQELGINQPQQKQKEPLVQPTTKKKRGFMGMKGKQGTKEISKGPSG